MDRYAIILLPKRFCSSYYIPEWLLMLESQGRVVLKIYSDTGLLMIAKPVISSAEAHKFFQDYEKQHPGATMNLTAMVPRI